MTESILRGGKQLIEERMTRLEALFESALANQLRRDQEEWERRRVQCDDLRRRDEHAAKQRREISRAVLDIVKRMERVEAVILGDARRGRPPIDERIKGIEDFILSARASWRTLALAGTLVFGCASFLIYLAQRMSIFFPGRSP